MNFVNNFVRKIFRKRRLDQVTVESEIHNGTSEDDDTLSDNEDDGDIGDTSVRIVVGTGHSVGAQRDHNEDALFSLQTSLVVSEDELPLGIHIIADGMGGHEHGELASGESVRTMASHLTEKVLLPHINGATQSEPIQDILVAGVEKVQRSVTSKVPGGGTTLTVALILGGQINFVHVGDSRACFIDTQGRVEVITHDHSIVQRLQDLGEITEEDALVHPQRNVLYQAIGQDEPFQPDVDMRPIPTGGHLLLCSDGLWGVVDREVIAEII